jgi:hypothetical protein
MPGMAEDVPLRDRKVRDLEKIILRSFRVRENMTPIYVDVGNNLERVALDQHQVVFGRRGSGKSCLLLYYRRVEARRDKVHTIYLSADTVKTLKYPDVLIRTLLAIFEGLPSSWWRRLFRRPTPAIEVAKDLRALLARAELERLKVTDAESKEEKRSRRLKVGGKRAAWARERGKGQAQSQERVAEFDQAKVDSLENHLIDYKSVLQAELAKAGCTYAVFIVDDFYLIDRSIQPDVIDCVHRLLRDTDLYFKIGTIRHRTTLLRTEPVHVGVQPTQDVDSIDLDQTLEDLDRTRGYLEEMLRLMGQQAEMEDATSLMSDQARRDLVLLSGGVPRDYLSIFVNGTERARNRRDARRVTPTDLRKAAAALVRETKFGELRRDAGEKAEVLEALFADLVQFCIVNKRKTAFLISEDEARDSPDAHELIRQLMDCKLIHVVEPSTSAASGRAGRFEAYTLDFGLFMEPRKRNIEIVRFWETDDQRRRVRLREAPIYPLAQAQEVLSGARRGDVEAALEVVDAVEDDTTSAELRLFP